MMQKSEDGTDTYQSVMKKECPFHYTDLNRHFKEYVDIYYSYNDTEKKKKNLLDVWQSKRVTSPQIITEDTPV